MPTIQNRRATAAQWTAANPVLAPGEIGFELDFNAIKIGDGLTSWVDLPYLSDEALSAMVWSGRLSEAVLNATYGSDALADPDSELRQAADTVFVGQSRQIKGGLTPNTLRVPTLAIDEVLPRPGVESIDVVWVEPGAGGKRYGVGRDGCIYTMTEALHTTAGVSWTRKGEAISHSIRTCDRGAFIKLRHPSNVGVLLTLASDNKVYRSTDDGETLSPVYTLEASHGGIGPGFFAEDQTTGDVYLAPYNGNNPQTVTTHNLPRSTDGGATFSTFATLPGQAGTADDTIKVRHIHGVQWDPVSERIFYMGGDTDWGGGIYRVNAAKDGIEKVVTNLDLGLDPETGARRATSINIAFFPDHIVWITDLGNSGMWALPRTAFGSATSDDVELLYRPNSTGWFTARASNDNTKWVLSSSNETNPGNWDPIDVGTHLYSVEREGGKWHVWEVATEKTTATSWAALSSVGAPEMHGDDFWLRRYGYGDRTMGQWRCRLQYAGGMLMPRPDPLPPVTAWTSLGSGVVDLAASQTIIFGQFIMPRVSSSGHNWRQDMLRIFNMGVYSVSGTGQAKVQVWNHTREALLFETILGEVRGGEGSSAPFVLESQVIPGDLIRFRLVENHNQEVTVNAFVVYGTGERGSG